MRCQHRTTRTAPLIDVAAGDFLRLRTRSSSFAAAATCSLCVQHLSMNLSTSFTTRRPPGPAFLYPSSGTLTDPSPCVRSASSFEKCRSVAEDPSSTRRARCAASCVKRAGARWWTGASARSWRRTARTCTTRSGAPSASPPPRISSARSSASSHTYYAPPRWPLVITVVSLNLPKLHDAQRSPSQLTSNFVFFSGKKKHRSI